MRSSADLAKYAQKLGLRFDDLRLLEQALTHSSFANEHPDQPILDNERLEFLGDAIIDFLAAEWLYARYPDMAEGNLTRLRAGLVRNQSLAAYARTLGLGDMLVLGRGEEESGGRRRERNLGGAFEAVAGALYLDRGMAAVRDFATPLFEPAVEEIIRNQSETDAKSRLQEWSQATMNLTPTYRTVSATGPDHAREFVVEVLIGDKVYGSGQGRSKQVAAQTAAQAALETIQQDRA
ncbi:MAG TPA: ribonuclease III [Aggregatilineales bacterium]|nr:ribonuclease III [Aggregatilineales bacterium]